ncbi:hypothetical protein ITI46_05515 [Streptomyces oryzae]|uniref:Uncharacterized protein n=1 Tax=Streptomyces oryzae TaxID=1434886 RepID=A0ABS3X6Z7_9ACTN|nr:hypothetical protein [Streptomyces oryzae]MBO8191150.1 hypothetical protein [Streptomyces oryzae]
MRELAPEHQPDPANPAHSTAQAGQAAPHGTSLSERGSFCAASCSCGWRGPARRARDRAREDGRAHLQQHGNSTTASPPDSAAGAL